MTSRPAYHIEASEVLARALNAAKDELVAAIANDLDNYSYDLDVALGAYDEAVAAGYEAQ